MDEVTVVFRKERELKSLAVNFMAECFLGDKLKVANSLKENTLSQTVFGAPLKSAGSPLNGPDHKKKPPCREYPADGFLKKIMYFLGKW